ncbi:hypothetical protein [Marinicella rhabdoformis]|uniref:hypothetical protein n=1 Tax=Marinicella rhabdoformis TaxID=2580566 RepID=UPI0012AEB54A|nr:hypothetical protein [Marinicella rhabdoformis]
MNPYQAKLESIQSRRLTMSQRTTAFIKSAAWLCFAFAVIPALLGMTWRGVEVGYGIDTGNNIWAEPLVYVFCLLNSLALLYLFFNALIQSKKLLTRCLSGIQE